MATLYTLTYAAGASNVSNLPASQSHSAGYEFFLSSKVPKRDGYVFTGWKAGTYYIYPYWGHTDGTEEIMEDHTGDIFQPGVKVALYDRNVTFTAQWIVDPDIKYTLSYADNSGDSLVTSMPSSQYHKASDVFPVRGGTPKRPGYKFSHWRKAMTNYIYDPGDMISISEDTTFIAVWERAAADLKSVTEFEIGTAPEIQFVHGIQSDEYNLYFKIGAYTYDIIHIDPPNTVPRGEVYIYRDYVLPLDILNDITDKTSETLTIELQTVTSSGTILGKSSQNVKVTVPSDIKPVIDRESVVVTDLNNIGFNDFDWDPEEHAPLYVANAKRTYGTIFQVAGNVTGQYGATIEEVWITIDGEVASMKPVNDTYTLSTGQVAAPETGKQIKISARDSRGRSTSIQGDLVTVYEYFNPKGALAVNISGTSVTLTITGDIAPVGNHNDKMIVLRRRDSEGHVVSTPLNYYVPLNYSFRNNDDTYPAISVTETVDDVASENYLYTAYIKDSKHVAKYSVNTLGGHTGDLSDKKYYANINEQGINFTDSDLASEETVQIPGEGQLTVTIPGTTLTIDGVSYPSLVGFPVRVYPGHNYVLDYTVNKLTNTLVKVSYFDNDSNYIAESTIDVDSGDRIYVPPFDVETDGVGRIWAMILFGQTLDPNNPTDVTRKFTELSFRELMTTTFEEITWFVETGDLGLWDPNQKYISKIQLRLAFSGTVQVYISYDEEEFRQVFRKSSQNLRSITIPINVKRSDHFRLRIEGIGQAKIYSWGYSTLEGSQYTHA